MKMSLKKRFALGAAAVATVGAVAKLSGANTVMPSAELRVSTSPACLTATTRVDSTGLADAAVATGAVAIPVKLPAPDEGTEEQPEPKSIADALAADAEDEGIADDGIADEEADEAGAAAELLELPELHAAAPTATPAAATDTARVR